MRALSRKLLRDLKTLRMQIFTLALLTACGVAVLVASWSSYVSLNEAKNKYYREYHFADLFAEIVRAPESLIPRIHSIPGVSSVEGRLVESALIDIAGQSEPALGRIISWKPDSQINMIHLREGRFPERGHLTEVLLHESFAKAHHLRPGHFLDITLKGQKTRVVVSGIGLSPEYIYALSPLAPFPDDLHFGVMWMNYEDLAHLVNMKGAFDSLILRLSPEANGDQIKSSLDRLLEPFGGLGSYDRNQQISHMFVQDEIRQQKSMSSIVPGIFISVAAFILHTVMSRLVSLHRTQIAALKSLGYTSRSLVLHYWKLVTIILVLGIVPAIVLAQGIGQWYAHLYEEFFRFPSIDFSLSRQALLIGTLAGLLPGWFASMLSLRSVFKLNPAEAMRPPSPSSFSLHMLNPSLGSLWRLFQPRHNLSKMVLRNIIAKPWRTTLSCLGIAAATAILINGGFWTDIIDAVIDRQFRQSNREDLEVHFQHPRSLEVLSEIARIPGVQFVEGARSVAVRLHYKNYHKDTVISAAESIGSLHRVLNREGKILNIPPGQVVLSQYFAKKYGMKSGDLISLSVSDKTTADFQAPIAGFVEDVVGSSIYANMVDLHHWLRETSGINSVYLKIDPTFSTRIYIRLKEMPEVASISVKELLLKSFNATLSGMIWTFTLILIFFAITITGAVLFNMARITLSEKSWELASMKIMGFNDRDVFQVLFLEMGLQVICALVPGMALGYALSYLSTKWIHTDTFAFPLVIEAKTYALAVVVVILTYFLIGFFLFDKIRKLNMTEALKARE